MKRVLKNIGTALALVLCAVFLFLLVCNVTIIVKGTLNPDEPPTVFGVTPMVVLSGSMSGSSDGHIEVGDLIFDTRADTDALKAGDVISFMDGKSVVTHRIIDVYDEDGERMLVTKGDANNVQDMDPVSADRVVDILRRRRGGRKNDDENERLRREIEELRAQNEKRTQSTGTANAADDTAKDADADKN